LFKVSRERVRLSEIPRGYTETELPEEAREDDPQVAGEDVAVREEGAAAEEKADEEAAARERAEALVAEAEAEASRILEEVRLRAEELRRDAYDGGFSEGRAEGEKKAAAAAAAAAAGERAAFERVLAEFNAERNRALDEFETARGRIKTLIFEILRKIVNLQYENDDNFFGAVIEDALERVKPAEKLTVSVGEADYERFFPSGSAVFNVDGEEVAATVVKASSLGPTEIIIDSGDVTVNAGPHTQLGRVEAALEKSGALK
jgi:flagellar assembly protein FliH